MNHFEQDRERYTTLLAKLRPAVEVSALIRPRMCLVALLTASDYIVMGILYHVKRDAVQSRLYFSSAVYPAFSRRTRWQQVRERHALEQWERKVGGEFAALATQLGVKTTIHLEFPPDASDTDIREIFLASPLPAVFG